MTQIKLSPINSGGFRVHLYALIGRNLERGFLLVCGGGKAGTQHPSFKWVNTMLGNVKNAIAGTFHSVGPKHVSRYLAEFEYRFNCRSRLGDMIEWLSYVALRTPPMPYRLLRMAEIGG